MMTNPIMYEVTGPEEVIFNLCVAKGYVPLVLHPAYRDSLADRLQTLEPAPWYLVRAGGLKLSGFLTVHPSPAGAHWSDTDADQLRQWLKDLPSARDKVLGQEGEEEV